MKASARLLVTATTLAALTMLGLAATATANRTDRARGSEILGLCVLPITGNPSQHPPSVPSARSGLRCRAPPTGTCVCCPTPGDVEE
jgi:hypothetical protein